jgi:hypothetical protein
MSGAKTRVTKAQMLLKARRYYSTHQYASTTYRSTESSSNYIFEINRTHHMSPLDSSQFAAAASATSPIAISVTNMNNYEITGL